MKIAVLDGYCLNPGDLSWDGLRLAVFLAGRPQNIVGQVPTCRDGPWAHQQ